VTLVIRKGQPEIYTTLQQLGISYGYFEAPADFSSEDDTGFWIRSGATRCKNLFLRNHKGDKHYLVIAPFYENISITRLEQHFKKGKISFASDHRLLSHLKVQPGAVSVFGLINDKANRVEVFLDERLRKYEKLSFLPNCMGAIITFSQKDLLRILDYCGNTWSFFNFNPEENV